MQVNHIDENTIRVRINKEELAQRGLKVLDLLGDKNKIQHFFYSILDEVDTDHTFTKNAPVTFQVMPNNGGLDLLITKVTANNKRNDLSQLMNPSKQKSEKDDPRRSFFDLNPADDVNAEMDPKDTKTNAFASKQSEKSFWKFQKGQSYYLDDLDALTELADNLRVSDLASSLYYERGKYFLELAFMNDDFAEMKPADAWAIANEYGIKIDQSAMNQVKQTGKCLLANDALGRLRYYFSNAKRK